MGEAAEKRFMGFPWEKSYPSSLKWDDPIEEKPIYSIMDEATKLFPNNNFMDFLGKSYSYRKTYELINKAARGFQKIGVTKGTKVGLFLPNCPYFVICYFAVLKAGGTVVNYNPLYATKEIAHQIKDSETEIMVTLDLKATYDKVGLMLKETPLSRVVIASMAPSLPFPKNLLFPFVKKKEIAKYPRDEKHISFDSLVRNNGNYTPQKINPREDIAVLQYTGGTTGVPKGAMLTHANLYANTTQLNNWFLDGEMGSEKMLAVIPFFHVFAMTIVMNMSIRFGAELILLPRFELGNLLQTIHDKKPTLFAAVPSIYVAVNASKKVSQYDLSSLKACMSGGAPLPAEVKIKFEKKTGATLVEGYGLTETSPAAVVNPFEGKNIPGSIGLPLQQTEIKILSTEDQKTEMPQGEKGEVCIKGPQVMKGYWKNQKATDHSVRDGFFHTGDVGYIDEDGYIFLVDRLKDVIIAGGYNIYPRNVEEAIYLHPAVEECVVLGIPHTYRGQTVKVFLKLKPNKTLSHDELNEFLGDKLSPIEIPKLFEIRDELPKTMIGKLSKKELLEEELKKQEKKAKK